METCSLGCDQPAKFFHQKTGVGRCSKNVSSCPVIRKQRVKQHADRRTERHAAEAARVPEPCECGAPGARYIARAKLWRCAAGKACPAIEAKRIATLKAEYGVANVAYIAGIQERRSKTLSETHARRSAEEKHEIAGKRADTIEQRYGARNASQVAEFQHKKVETHRARTGVDYPMQTPEALVKRVETYRETLGVDHPALSPLVQETKRRTMMERWGVEFPYRSEEIWMRFLASMRERWGAENAMHHVDLAERAFKHACRAKPYLLGERQVWVRGYEPAVLDHLIETRKIKPADIHTRPSELPVVWYLDEYQNRRRRYYTDIFLPRHGVCVEVKSTFTQMMTAPVTGWKAGAVRRLGFGFILAIVDEKQDIRFEGDLHRW